MFCRTSMQLPFPVMSLIVFFVALSPGQGNSKKEKTPKPFEKELTNSIGMKLVYIKPGKLMMGSPREEKKRQRDEGPVHEVEILKGFYLGMYEVTQAEYEKVMDNNPSWFSKMGVGKDQVKGMDTTRFPVENVNYEDAVKFCEKLSQQPEEQKGKRVYRLPTEAEWEYACRAGTNKATHYGDSLSSNQANFNGTVPYGDAKKGNDLKRTCKVGSFKPNAFGLYDMHGNVYEWCSDWWGEKYYENSPKQDPTGLPKGFDRVIRGGSWSRDGWYCRSAYRFGLAPSHRPNDVGLRVVLVFSGK